MMFDLFKLHSKEDTPHSLIWIKFNSSLLKNKYLNLLKTNSQKEIAKKISKKLNTGLITIEKHLIKLKNSNKKVLLPLSLIIELIKLIDIRLKNVIIKSIESLSSRNNNFNKNVKAVKYLNLDLAKLIGAHIADGYLKREGNTYRIRVSDERKDAIEKCSIWVNNIFNINPIVKYNKGDNVWECWFNNKIIGRYFERIFDIKHGKKAYIVKEPKIIKSSTLKIRNAFVLGILTFDGGVKTSGTIALSSMSKKLIDNVYNILKLNGIKVNKNYNIKKRSWILESISGRNIDYLRKWQLYFEKETWKYKRLQFFLNNKRYSIKKLNYLFPEHYRSKIGLTDVYKSIKNIKSGKAFDIQKELKSNNLNVANTTIYKYLYILNKSGLISKNYHDNSNNNAGWREAIYNIK